MRRAWTSLAAACALVIGLYVFLARPAMSEFLYPNPADAYYNLLVQSFRAGQLNLKQDVPPCLAHLPDPYDPVARAQCWDSLGRMLDLSYYNGKLYLYFGITPALVLFWPYAALTSHYLFYRQAALIFFSVGFLTSIGLLLALWRRYFVQVGAGVVTVCALALGLATIVPAVLPQADIYEVAIGCGYMLTMLAFAAIWRALHVPEHKCRWLIVASIAYGLAVGARPHLLFGAAILLVPVANSWPNRHQFWTALLAAASPIVLIGCGLMLYNALRFGSPFEFGTRYLMCEYNPVTTHLFGLRFLWFNFRLYFLDPVWWTAQFPFVHDATVPPVPAGHGRIQDPFGVLTNVPLVWLAVVVPLAWRNRSAEARVPLRCFITAVGLYFAVAAMTICVFWATILRYELDFLPALLLLAVVGILSLERIHINQPFWRRTLRGVWGLLLGFSVAFNLLLSLSHFADERHKCALTLVELGRPADAIKQYEQAEWIKPNDAAAFNGWGIALARLGRLDEAVTRWEQALRTKPDNAETHNNLAQALARLGRLPEAIAHWEQALQISPNFAQAHCNLGIALAQTGQTKQAMDHWRQALRIKPNLAEAHYNLATALEQAGKLPDAIDHYQQALRINPRYTDARNALARLQPGSETTP